MTDGVSVMLNKIGRRYRGCAFTAFFSLIMLAFLIPIFVGLVKTGEIILKQYEREQQREKGLKK